MRYQEESDLLKKSAWPRCDEIASRLQAFGPAAILALQAAATSKTHHVRSACLRSIYAIDPIPGRELAEKLLQDRAYEVRETAAKILGVPIPG